MDVTGEEIDPCHQGQGAVALVFAIAHHRRAFARQGWAIRRGCGDRLDPGFLVIPDDGEAPAAVFALALPTLRLPTQHRHLPVDTEDFSHLGLEFGITLFQVVAHPRFREGRLLCGLTSCSARILQTVPWASFARLGCPAVGPCWRACAASSRVVHSSWG